MKNLANEILILRGMTMPQLREKYFELFGEQTSSPNRAWLIKRLAFRIQEKAKGGLSERGRRRVDELKDEAFIRVKGIDLDPSSLKQPPLEPKKERDSRLPPPGEILSKLYKGETHQVQVLEDEFRYNGTSFKSLSQVATLIAGTRWNGFRFFGLGAKS